MFEYQILQRNIHATLEIETSFKEKMNSLGKEGWKLHSHSSSEKGLVIIMEREIPILRK